jgi:protein SCO1
MILSCVGSLGKYQVLLCLWFLVLLPVDLCAHVPGAPQTTATAVNTKAPDFILLDQDGKPFASKSLRGKVVALDFIFTTCIDVCPLFTANFAQLQKTLKSRQRADFFIVSITTDPEVDSPKVLKSYAQRYRADFATWAFLTGTEAELKKVWNGFGIRVIPKGRGLVQHTSLTTVIDPQGIRRFNFLGEKWQLKDLERDMMALLDKMP